MIITIKLNSNTRLNNIFKLVILDKKNKIILNKCVSNKLTTFLNNNEVYKIIAIYNNKCLKTIIYTNQNMPNIITLNFCEKKYHLITINLKDLSYEGLPINGKVRIKWKTNKQ